MFSAISLHTLIYFGVLSIYGWFGLGTALLVYLGGMKGKDEAVVKAILDSFWIYMALITVLFVLMQRNPLYALLWWAVFIVVFELLFAQFALSFKKWQAYQGERSGLSYLWGGFLVLGLILGFPFDVNYNLTWGRLHFLQKPRLLSDRGDTLWERIKNGDWTFTANLIRNVAEKTWQGAEARFICLNLIHPLQRDHCGKIVQLT